MKRADIEKIVSRGEGSDQEFKRTTGELRGGMQTLCAFLNGDGGIVLFGVGPDGSIRGQEVSDKTLREIADALDRFEPRPEAPVDRVRLKGGLEVLALRVKGGSDGTPFTYDGRPYERIESTTRRMPKARYERLLLDGAHSRRRWENQEAEYRSIRDIDRQEVFRIAESARAVGRLFEPPGRNLGEALDRFDLRRDGQVLRAAVVLFGKKFPPDFPQCEIRLARFRGTDKDEFLDQRAVYGPAFKLLEEAGIFCQRHFPLPGKIVPEQFQRVDTPLIPTDAMREILINALIHRDYSIAGGSIGLAIFDDRVEVWSPGTLPGGLNARDLSRKHSSVRRNPTIAEVFYRAGLIEKWGRGTNRVIAQCRDHGITPPEFEEVAGSVLVTFRVEVGRTAPVTDQVTDQAADQATDQAVTILQAAQSPRTRAELQEISGLRHLPHFRKVHLKPLLERGWLEMTIPDKPRSPRQRYRTTSAGLEALKKSRA